MTVLPELSFQEISLFFHLPISQAAKELKVCETLLKKICRVNGIKRWPHRKIRSIDTMINLLEFRLQSEKLSEKEKTRMRNEILDLTEKKSFFMTSPNTTYQSIIPKNTLQSFSKTKLKNQKSFSIFLHSTEASKKSTTSTTTSLPTLSQLSTQSPSSNFSSFILNNMKMEKNNEDDSEIVNNGEKKSSVDIVNNNLNKNVNNNEEDEEEVLNLLFSLKKKKNQDEKNSDDKSADDVHMNDRAVDEENKFNEPNVNTPQNDQFYPNELYKLSLVAILNPINDDDNTTISNNNIPSTPSADTHNINYKNTDRPVDPIDSKINETKMRNILRRSLENFHTFPMNENTKKRKVDCDYKLDSSRDDDHLCQYSPSKLVKLH